MLTKDELLDKSFLALKEGKLIIFPTETVYGLGACALNEDAIMRIYRAKRRPQENPLILHIPSIHHIDLYASEVPQIAYAMAELFWPGPLTLVLPRKATIPAIVSAGHPTVALRAPSHPLAQELLKRCNFPIAAPSANISGKLSPIRAEMLEEELLSSVELVLKDDEQHVLGIESTVIFPQKKEIYILRPGWITEKMLAQAFPQHPIKRAYGNMLSPGASHIHYQPSCPVWLFHNTESLLHFSRIRRIAKIGVLYLNKIDKRIKAEYSYLAHSEMELAQELYWQVYQMQDKVDHIFIQAPSRTSPLYDTLMDRLMKMSDGYSLDGPIGLNHAWPRSFLAARTKASDNNGETDQS